MQRTLKARLISRRDTEANFDLHNPILLENEEITVIRENGTMAKKIGDGTSAYSDLPFSEFVITDTYTKEEIDEIISAMSGQAGENKLGYVEGYYDEIDDYLDGPTIYLIKNESRPTPGEVNLHDYYQYHLFCYNFMDEDYNNLTLQIKTNDGKIQYRTNYMNTETWSTIWNEWKEVASSVDIDAINAKIGDIDTALDNIIAIQNGLIGGDTV